MKLTDSIFVAGHKGLVGSAVLRNLQKKGYENLIVRERSQLDLTDQIAVNRFFDEVRPDYVIMAAAKVGGIIFNRNYQADFLYDNLMIGANTVHAAAQFGVKKYLFLGSSCIYPKLAPQPIKEEYLLSGPLEPTNEGYALAKITGLKLCEKYMEQHGKCFISCMPTNLYGPNDNFHPDHSHVIPGLIRRFHEAKVAKAKEVVIWGTGKPMREFLFVDDLAEALFVLMQDYESPTTINIGSGKDCTIAELAQTIREVVGFEGELIFDSSKPDGPPRKILDSTRMRALGWMPQVELRHGLEIGYRWALENDKF